MRDSEALPPTFNFGPVEGETELEEMEPVVTAIPDMEEEPAPRFGVVPAPIQTPTPTISRHTSVPVDLP